MSLCAASSAIQWPPESSAIQWPPESRQHRQCSNEDTITRELLAHIPAEIFRLRRGCQTRIAGPSLHWPEAQYSMADRHLPSCRSPSKTMQPAPLQSPAPKFGQITLQRTARLGTIQG
jgi:hypothetical protein